MHSEKGKADRIGETGRSAGKAAGRKKSAGSKKGRVISLAESEPSSFAKPVERKLAQEALPGGIRSSEILPGAITNDPVFALDIGTRTVVGVVGVQEESCFRVIATEVVEHKNRAMLDGQIHDIEQVAAAAAAAKEKLEARLGMKLKKVAIAAAGRVLKTCQVRVDKNLEPGREIDAEFISSLEIEGIQRAQMILDEEAAAEDKTQFYCVGYSVINYYLNGYVISRLTGHKGKTVGADILATFLPLIVVDSLYTVMGKVGLEVSSLTLEPIAAINVTIPPDLRLLNLALVDIGAGTSDIALTKDGSVIGYAMVPVAGDEITEKISQHYLVDFNTGEKIKIALSSGRDKIAFTDILKIKHTVSPNEVLNVIESTLQLLASTISKKILEFNHKAPNAIFLVGGGSRIPRLTDMIAAQIELPTDRVVVRGRDVIRDIKFSDKKLYGPESITPYGIAVTAQMYGGKDFLTVTVNDRKIKLFNSKKLTVADALILFGFDASQLIGRTGKGLTYYVNGEKRQVRGEFGKAAEIAVNGKPASIDTPIAFGDNVTVIPAEDGKDASVKAYELAPSGYSSGTVRLNGNPVDISTIILVNGSAASKDTLIQDGDEVFISQIVTLRDLLEAGGMDGADGSVTVNGNDVQDMDYRLKNGDMVKCVTALPPEKEQKWKGADLAAEGTVRIDSNASGSPNAQTASEALQEPAVPAPEKPELFREPVHQNAGMQVTVNGKSVLLKDDRTQYIFVDIFNYIDFDLSKPQGTIMLRLNGRQAAFTDIIQSGDVIEIYWKN
jgi:cell division protein FtsA